MTNWVVMKALPLAEAILDCITQDSYKINVIPTNPEDYHSMREFYEIDSALSEKQCLIEQRFLSQSFSLWQESCLITFARKR